LFSSLDGFRFEWTIDDGKDVVKKITAKDASSRVSDGRKEMENLKMHSDVFFLKGINVGKAKITVKLDEKGYDLDSSSINISITEPIAILPERVMRILPTSSFQFQLAKVRISEKDPIYDNVALPSKQFQWSSFDENIGEI